MSQLLIETISMISIPFGCLLYTSPKKISLISCAVYAASVLQNLYFIVTFIYSMIFQRTSILNDFNQPYFYESNSNGSTIRWFSIIGNGTTLVFELSTLYGTWKYRKSIAKSIKEAKNISKIFDNKSFKYLSSIYDSSLINKNNIKIILTTIKIIITLLPITNIFNDLHSIFAILFRYLYISTRIAHICKQEQFAGLVSVVETLLIDINQRIEKLTNVDVDVDFAVDVVDNYRSNRRLLRTTITTIDNYQLHPFFQYQEIIPSTLINIRPSLINFNSNKNGLGANRSGYFDFHIEEEEQPARNQFYFESKGAHPHQHILQSEISPRKICVKYCELFRGKKRRKNVDSIYCKKKIGSITELVKIHSRVIHLAAEVSKCYEMQLGANQYFLRLNGPLMMYLSAISIETNSSLIEMNDTNFWMIILDFIIRLFYVFEISLISENVNYQNNRTERNLLAFSRARLNPRIAKEVEDFIWQIKLSPIEFNVGPNGRIGMSYFSSTVTTILTSSIVLLQISGML